MSFCSNVGIRLKDTSDQGLSTFILREVLQCATLVECYSLLSRCVYYYGWLLKVVLLYINNNYLVCISLNFNFQKCINTTMNSISSAGIQWYWWKYTPKKINLKLYECSYTHHGESLEFQNYRGYSSIFIHKISGAPYLLLKELFTQSRLHVIFEITLEVF